MTKLSRRHFLALSAGAAGLAGRRIAPAGAQSVISVRVSSSMPMDKNAAHFAWFDDFQSRLKAAVGDKIKLDYFPNGQLGKEADVVQQVKVGSIDMMITGSSIWATVAPEFGMLDLGYMFDSFAHAAKAVDAGVGAELAKILLSRTNVTTLGWGFHFGARNVYTKKTVAALADLRDVKLRVLPAPAFIETFKAMGAIPTPIPINELYTALQTGVVDGFEHDAGTVLAQKFYEVSNHCFLTEHLFSPMIVTIGKRGFDKLDASVRPAFMKAAAEATEAQRTIAITGSTSAIEELKKLGVTYTPMPPDERRAMQKLMVDKIYGPFYAQYPVTKPLFDQIAAARAA